MMLILHALSRWRATGFDRNSKARMRAWKPTQIFRAAGRSTSKQRGGATMKMQLLLTGLLFTLCAGPALATNCSAIPNTFVNGTVADATQVNANFTNIQNCANNNLAHNGANSDITSLNGLTTPITSSQLSTTGVTAGSYTLSNITVGADGRVTAASNGVITAVTLHSQVFASGGTFTVPSAATTSTVLKFTVCGGGAGGGGAATANGAAGGGGGSGACSISFLHGFTAGQNATIVIGSGGAGGTSGGGTGSAGGPSTVTYASNQIIISGGGQGGTGSTSLVIVPSGGAASSGVSVGSSGLTLDSSTISGSAAASQSGGLGIGASTNGYSGAGGSCWFGAGGFQLFVGSIASSVAQGFCSGGGGAIRAAGTNQAGGNGTPGMVMVEWAL